MMRAMEKPPQRPEGKLIKDALDARPKLSQRGLADRAGLSEGRARQIINGYASVGQGQFVEVVGPAETVARLFQVLDLTPEQASAAGRDDVAEILEGMYSRSATVHVPAATGTITGLEDVPAEDLLEELKRRIISPEGIASTVEFGTPTVIHLPPREAVSEDDLTVEPSAAEPERSGVEGESEEEQP